MSNSIIEYVYSSKERIFPKVKRDFYKSASAQINLSSEQKLACNFLSLSNRKIETWKELLRWKLDIKSKISFLLTYHKMAIEAELAERWERADFFWTQTYSILRKILKNKKEAKAFYENFAKSLEFNEVKDFACFFDILINEVFVDIHSAFYNGYITSSKKIDERNRAFVHIEYIISLLEFSDLCQKRKAVLINSALKLKLSIYEEQKKLDEAIDLCKLTLNLYSEQCYYQDKLAELYLSKTLGKLSNSESPYENLRDSNKLLKLIDCLKNLQIKYPYNISIFQVIGFSFYINSIKLANGNRLSSALVSVQKALTYNPGLKEAEEGKEKLVLAMMQFQKQMKEVIAQVAINPQISLNEEGRRLKNEAESGLTRLNIYINSPVAREITSSLNQAYAYNLWSSIGLEKTVDKWEEKSCSLLSVINSILKNPPKNNEILSVIWKEKSEKNELLSDLDAALICKFIEEKLFKKVEAEEFEEIQSSENIPILNTEFSEKVPKEEPFKVWLFSGQNMNIKFQSLIAIILLFIGVGIFI